MNWLDAVKYGASLAAGGAAGVGTTLLTGNPLLGIGVGGEVAGTGLQLAGTHTRQTGLTDAQIAASEAATRQAYGARIEEQNRRSQQQLASHAAQGNLGGSGIVATDAARLNGARDSAYSNLDAQLEQHRLGVLSQRQTVPVVGGGAVLGHLVTALSSPAMELGAAQLAGHFASDWGGGGPAPGQGHVNFGQQDGWTGNGWDGMQPAEAGAQPLADAASQAPRQPSAWQRALAFTPHSGARVPGGGNLGYGQEDPSFLGIGQQYAAGY